MDNILLYLETAIKDSILILWKITYIVFIVMLILETLKTLKILDYINEITSKLTKYLGISKSANPALIIGVLIGISYGAGAIITSYKNNEMTKKDVMLVSTFLCICHAIIEDTLLFVRIGANLFIILVLRIIIAIVVTYFLNIYLTKKERKYESS